jgi:DNA-binding transcriptional LysR family regulator
MELRHLRYFLAVAEHQSFRKAARALNVSHPSLSAQIIDLEQEVGTRLFERSNRRVSLTDPGQTFLTGARRTLECVVRTLETTQQASRGLCGELRIANLGMMCPSYLAHLIRSFREHYPKVHVSIVQQRNVERIEDVLERAEIGIGYLPAEPGRDQSGRLKSCVIATAPIGVAVAGAALEQKQSHRVKLCDFAHEPFLILDPKYAPGYSDWVCSIFSQMHFEPTEIKMVDSVEGFFTLISAGAGVALLSPLHFEGWRDGVCFRRVMETIADFPLSLVWDAKRGSQLASNFLDVVHEVACMTNGAVLKNLRRGSLCVKDEPPEVRLSV